MARSLKKGLLVNEKILKRVEMQKKTSDKAAIKTWARDCHIAPDFVGHKFAVHNGKKFIEVLITESMVGHRLGEFAPTRTFKGHGKVTKRVLEKT